MSSTGIALRVAGALSGVVSVPSLDTSVTALREEVARVLGVDDASQVKLIVGGRNLPNTSQSLASCGITQQSRILVTKGAASVSGLAAAEQKARHLEKLKAAAEKLAAADGRGLTDAYELSLENQDGTKLQLKEEDRKALVTGLALHTKAKGTVEKGDFATALDEMMLAEQYFALCDRTLTDGIDNIPLLLIDIVWCCYKLADANRLGTCRSRLEAARTHLARAHGPNQERLRTLHGGFHPEMATYLRLDVLSGVVAYHMQEWDTATKYLDTAYAKWQRLQVSDEDLAKLQELGFRSRESRRGLRFSGGDVETAVTFITQQRAKKEERNEERKRQKTWLYERTQYGKTASGNYIDHQYFERLCLLGHDKILVGEALRCSENDLNVALDLLVDLDSRAGLQKALLQKAIADSMAGSSQHVDPEKLQQLVTMGYRESFAQQALTTYHGDVEAAAAYLSSVGQVAGVNAPTLADEIPQDVLAQLARQSTDPSNVASTSAAPGAGDEGEGVEGGARGARRGKKGKKGGKKKEEEEEGSSDEEEVDEEEEALQSEIRRGVVEDPLAAYDVDVQQEADALHLFRSLLESQRQQQQQHQQQ